MLKARVSQYGWVMADVRFASGKLYADPMKPKHSHLMGYYLRGVRRGCTDGSSYALNATRLEVDHRSRHSRAQHPQAEVASFFVALGPGVHFRHGIADEEPNVASVG